MVQLSQERLDELKKLLTDKTGKEPTDQEVLDSAHSLITLAEICFDHAMWEAQQKRKLRDNPKGFHLDDGKQYSCMLCRQMIQGETSWWDLLGTKCLLCQKALWDGVIPSYAIKNSDSYFSIYDLERTFGIKSQTARKLVREGKLKARIVMTEDGKPHHYIFLKSENPRSLDFERRHRYLNRKCKCPDPECSYCYEVVCLQKDCPVHPLEKKREPRMALIERLEKKRGMALSRSEDEKLDKQIREFNLKEAKEKERSIVMLEESLGLDASYEKDYMKILITGVPGTGKTTVGEALERTEGFKHFNFETDTLMEFIKDPKKFIEKIGKSKRHTVITWGFMPERQTELVLQLKDAGFKLIWFDGNREAALKAFNKRGDVPESAFYVQMGNIESHNVVKRITPVIYNTFDKDGRFKDIEKIVSDILSS